MKYQISTDMTVEYALNNYQAITFPKLSNKLKNSQIRNPILAVAANHEEAEAGLLLAEFDRSRTFSEIVSLYVKPEYRRQGVASKMLDIAEKVLTKAGYSEIRIYQRSNWEDAGVLSQLLKQRKWQPPEALMLIVKSNIEKVTTIEHEDLAMPKGYKLTSWDTLSQEDIENLKQRLHNSGEFPQHVNPFPASSRIAPRCSTVVMHGNEIAGWNIGFRNRNDLIEYNSLYFFPKHRSLNLAKKAVIASFRAQKEVGVPNMVTLLAAHNRGLMRWTPEMVTSVTTINLITKTLHA